VKLWIGADAFVDQAISRVGAAPDPAFVPSLAVLASADCDAQWSWHVDPASASTAASADAGCNRCPAEIEPLVRGGPPTTRRWCPADAAVLAVDDRRAAP
jgi:hypothetical protein